MRYLTALLSVLVTLLAMPAASLAADATPVVDQYQSPVSAASETTSALPFTGVELSLIAVAGVLLLAGGMLLARLGRAPSR